MKLLGLSLVVIGMTFAAIPALAQGEATTFTLTSHSEGGSGYFMLDGQTTKNPTLNVPANTEITITFTAADGDGTHNLCVGDTCTSGANSGYVTKEGDTQTLTVNSGTKTIEYFCQPHKASTPAMKGTFAVAGSAAPVETKGSPGFELVGVALAMLGAALLVRHRRN